MATASRAQTSLLRRASPSIIPRSGPRHRPVGLRQRRQYAPSHPRSSIPDSPTAKASQPPSPEPKVPTFSDIYPSRQPPKFTPGKPLSYDPEEASFHPVAVGLVAGFIISFGVVYVFYVRSGAKELLRSAKETKARLDEQAARLFPSKGKGEDKAREKVGADGEAMLAEELQERYGWFVTTAAYYAGFVPGATEWLNGKLDKMDRAGQTRQERVAIDALIRDCHGELLGLEIKKTNKATAKKAWVVVFRCLSNMPDRDTDEQNSGHLPWSGILGEKQVKDQKQEEDAKLPLAATTTPVVVDDVKPSPGTAAVQGNIAKKIEAKAQASAAWLKTRASRE